MRLAVFSLLSLAGCAQLGSGTGAPLPDVHARPDAREVAEHPCAHGDVAACVAKCARADDAQACNAAGVLFEFDDGERSDPAVASGFYRRACDASYAPGCNNLAWLYLRGRGVPKDPPHAMFLFMAAFDAARIACSRGDASGCLLAGEMLYDGRVESKAGEDDAIAFFRSACDLGEPRGCERTRTR